jgi:hypothetical protein
MKLSSTSSMGRNIPEGVRRRPRPVSSCQSEVEVGSFSRDVRFPDMGLDEAPDGRYSSATSMSRKNLMIVSNIVADRDCTSTNWLLLMRSPFPDKLPLSELDSSSSKGLDSLSSWAVFFHSSTLKTSKLK